MERTLIFDAEGVVIDTESLWDQAQTELLARRGVPYDRATLKALLTGRSVLEGAQVIRDVVGLAEDAVALARERLEIMHGLLAGGISFIDGFEAFLERVRAAGHPTCVATAMDPGLFAVADRALGLRSLFNGRVVTLADIGGRGKPEPDLFLEAAGRCGSRPDACLVIEDAPNGIRAARRAGMRCIALTTTHARDELQGADQICDGFAEICLG